MLAAVAKHPSYSFGFRNFLADIAWLQAVQASGSLKMTRSDYDRLHRLLNVVSDLDPRFEIPYLLGGLVLGESQDHGREALQVFGRGKAQFPREWRFPFYMGFTYYFTLADPASAGREMMEASALPDCPAFVPGIASRMMSEAGNPEAALMMLTAIAQQETDDDRRTVLERRIREVAVERDLQLLQRAVEMYREKTGGAPQDLKDLLRAGILAEIPKDPGGGRYLLDREGKVHSDRVQQRLRVFRKE
ncbi:MAG: hypothetical protein AB1346_01350 [Thermodesulfobacteriota bacterium]